MVFWANDSKNKLHGKNINENPENHFLRFPDRARFPYDYVTGGRMTVVAIVSIVIVFLFLLLIILPRVLMGLKTGKLKGKPVPTPHKPSARRIKSGAKTVLYFYTPACGACRVQEPIIERLRKSYPDAIFKIDASVHREAASAFGVLGVPFLAFIEEGKLVSAKVGVQPETAIRGFFSE